MNIENNKSRLKKKVKLLAHSIKIPLYIYMTKDIFYLLIFWCEIFSFIDISNQCIIPENV